MNSGKVRPCNKLQSPGSSRPTGKPHLTACCSGRSRQLAIPLAWAIIGYDFAGRMHLATMFSPRFTIFVPRFHHPIFVSVVFQLPKISADKPNKPKNEPGTHHNSPQTPKTRLSHSKVVGPRLLTLLRPRRPYFSKRARTRFLLANSLSAGFPATIGRDARGRVAQLDRASAF